FRRQSTGTADDVGGQCAVRVFPCGGHIHPHAGHVGGALVDNGHDVGGNVLGKGIGGIRVKEVFLHVIPDGNNLDGVLRRISLAVEQLQQLVHAFLCSGIGVHVQHAAAFQKLDFAVAVFFKGVAAVRAQLNGQGVNPFAV